MAGLSRSNNIDTISRVFIAVCIAALCISLCSFTVSAEELRLNLNEGWVIKTGDNPVWAATEFDDKSWKSVRVGKVWEEAGLEGYDGYAWYRLRFEAPEKFNHTKELGNGFLVLSLGYVDDVDVTYFNGVEIGSTGSMPPDYSPAYKVLRKYRIPTSLIRRGKSNVIAVRVYDGKEGGGLYDGTITLRAPALEDLLEVSFQIGESDGIYHSPELLAVSLKISNKSISKFNTDIVCTLKSDRFDDDVVIDSKRLNVEIDANAEVCRTIKFHPSSGGFYKVTCTYGRDKDELVSKSMFFGYDPVKSETPLTREDDFDDFWVKCRGRLAGVKPQFKVTKSDRSTTDINVYLVEMRSYGNVRVRGWYTVPNRTGPHPAILSVPGYNGTMRPNMYRKMLRHLL